MAQIFYDLYNHTHTRTHTLRQSLDKAIKLANTHSRTHSFAFLINFEIKKISIKFHFHWQPLFNCSLRPDEAYQQQQQQQHLVHLIDKCETFDFYGIYTHWHTKSQTNLAEQPQQQQQLEHRQRQLSGPNDPRLLWFVVSKCHNFPNWWRSSHSSRSRSRRGRSSRGSRQAAR